MIRHKINFHVRFYLYLAKGREQERDLVCACESVSFSYRRREERTLSFITMTHDVFLPLIFEIPIVKRRRNLCALISLRRSVVLLVDRREIDISINLCHLTSGSHSFCPHPLALMAVPTTTKKKNDNDRRRRNEKGILLNSHLSCNERASGDNTKVSIQAIKMSDCCVGCDVRSESKLNHFAVATTNIWNEISFLSGAVRHLEQTIMNEFTGGNLIMFFSFLSSSSRWARWWSAICR